MWIQSTKTNIEPSKKYSADHVAATKGRARDDGTSHSLVLFAAVRPNPVLNALAGAIRGLNAIVLIICAGLSMTMFTLAAAFSRAVRAGME